ncbi:MAG: polysaccharide deacetylase family protein [Oleiphilaceae bacterium]|nr:polysaccharide deacetylase family protein [Oleiphilaceae bacterium]
MKNHPLVYCRFLLSALLLWTLPMSSQADLVILAYHHVSNETPASTSTTPDLFRDQLAMIEELDMKVVALEEASHQALEEDKENPLRVALTFDDAYESVYEEAWPLLRDRGMPFTLFVTTDALDQGIDGYMSWEQVAELARHELVTIGNHSADHGAMIARPDEDTEALEKRIARSLDQAQKRIREKTGVESTLFAHPYGEFSPQLTQALEQRDWLGYAQHSGVLGPHSDPRNIPRFPMANAFGGLATLKNKLRARNFPVPHEELPDPLYRENPPTLTMPLPEGWDAGRLTCFAPGQGAMDLETLSGQGETRVQIQADKPINSRRSRYNCTYPAGDGRFYWLSQPWFNPDKPEG